MGFNSALKGLNRQIFIVRYLQFVEGNHLNATVCSTGYRVSTLVKEMHKSLPVSAMANPVENVSLKPSGSSQEMAAM